MRKVIDIYKKSFKEYGDSPKSVLWPKGKQSERFDALTAHVKGDGFRVLDFGCGLAHMKNYLDNKFQGITYVGVDIVNDFIELNKNKYPESDFKKIESYSDVIEQYDYIMISGAFNIKYSKDDEKNFDLIKNTLIHLFEKTNVLLSVNFMTDKVDFTQENAYHQNMSKFFDFVNEKLSKRIVVDSSYMPYEYTVSIFKNDSVARPDNVYI